MKIIASAALVAALSLSTFGLIAGPPDGGLVVHEWGTFTSFQGGDGALLSWKPLETSKLPQFVYTMSKPGLGRQSISPYAGGGKVMAITTQRMETPVVYFYSDREETVDLKVNFPQGAITEWYPQATTYGPAKLSSDRSDAGAEFPKDSSESMIRWSGLQVIPPLKPGQTMQALPTDTSGSHYFSARETDSDILRTGERSKGDDGEQVEKFLFYRGVGNFTTPLKVTMTSDDAVSLANTGQDILPNLFVVSVKDKVGRFYPIDGLKAGEEKSVGIAFNEGPASCVGFTMQIEQAMAQALVKTGLYQREAEAMVKTWEDSWFAEDGVRVLYLLPRAWTDATLPMTVTPTPKALVRIMVGRAEVLTPGIEKALVQAIAKAGKGDLAASAATRELLKGLGRFAEPAFVRAVNATKLQPEDQVKVYALLNDARKAN